MAGPYKGSSGKRTGSLAANRQLRAMEEGSAVERGAAAPNAAPAAPSSSRAPRSRGPSASMRSPDAANARKIEAMIASERARKRGYRMKPPTTGAGR